MAVGEHSTISEKKLKNHIKACHSEILLQLGKALKYFWKKDKKRQRIRIVLHLWTETLEVKKQWNNDFKILKIISKIYFLTKFSINKV